MDHLAVMKKSWGFIQKILDGEKTIESRWHKTRKAPWGRIEKGNTIFFKNSGEPVTIRATVSNVIELEGLTPKRVKEALSRYWGDLGISKNEVSSFYKRLKNKRYCILIFLNNPKRVVPFNINKKGFGAMTSWICIEDVNRIKS